MASQNDNQQLLDALRRVGNTSATVAQNSRYTPPAGGGGRAQVTLNDERLRALRAAPDMADRINAVAAGKPQPSGALGNIGKLLIDNPVSKTVLSGLTIVDTPRRAVISGVRELVDMVDSNPNTQASFSDLFKQARDVSYGFGTAFPMEGWGGRIVGFIGDVALDPITYATFGATIPKTAMVKGGLYANQSLRSALGVKTLAGAEGRFALARMAKVMGASDEVVKNVAAKGRIGLPKEIADNMGLKRAGIYYFGTRVRVPFSGPIADAIQKGLVRTRLGFFDTPTGQRIGRQFALRGTNTQADTSAQRFALATGQLTPEQAGAFVGEFAAQDVQRAAKRIAVDTAVKYARPLFEDPEIDSVRTTVFRLLDAPEEKWNELGIVPTAQELRAYEKIRPVFQQMHADIEAAFKGIDPNFQFGEIKDYLPHMASDEALRLMEDSASPYAKQIRQYLTVNQTDNVGSFRARNLRKGSDWFGQDGKFPALTQADIDGGVQRLNQLFRERTGSQFDFFETDMKKILERYAGYYGQQIGTAKYMDELFKSGLLTRATQTAEFNEDLLDSINAAVKAATNEVSASYKQAYDAGRRLTTELGKVFDWSVRKKPTVTRPTGPLQQTLKQAEDALKEVLPEEVAAARLQSAKTMLRDTINNLNESWRTFKNQFAEESAYVDMLQMQHDALVKAHEDVLDRIVYITKNYQDEISPTGRVGLMEDVASSTDVFVDRAVSTVMQPGGKPVSLAEELDTLKNQLSDLDMQINDVGASWEEMLRNQQNFLNDFEKYLTDPFAGVGNTPADRITGMLRFSDRGKLYTGLTKGRDKIFSGWAGQNVSDEVRALRAQFDPRGEFGVNVLGRTSVQDVRRILATGFSSASDLRELRLAANWLVARDVIVNGGRVPTDAEFFGRLDKLKKLVELSNRVDKEVRGGVRGVEDIATSRIKAVADAQASVDTLQTKSDEIVNRINILDDELQVLLERESLNILDEGRISVIEDQLKILDEEFAKTNRELASANKDLARANEVTKPETREALDVIMRGNYRQLAEDLSEAASEFYFHSQVSIMFNSMVDEAASLGLVPTERMYNALVSKITEYDLELAQSMMRQVDQATDIFTSMRDRVKAYTGRDVNAYLLSDMYDMFNNPARAAEADVIRETFPEIEAVVLKHRSSMRAGRAFFQSDQGEEIAADVLRVMNEFEIPLAPGIAPSPQSETARRISRGARTMSMDGRDFAEEAETFAVRAIGSRESQAAEFEARAASVKRNINKLKEYAAKGNTPAEQRQVIDDLVNRYDETIARVKQRERQSLEALKRVTGARGARTSDRIITNVIRMGDAFGIAAPLKRALEGGPYAVDSFFADLIGGTKLDLSAGYRTVRRQGRKLVRTAGLKEEFVNVYEDALGKLVDGNGRRVNLEGQLLDDKGEVILERVGDEMVPKMGRKSARPTVLVTRDNSELAKIRYRAMNRYHKLRSVSDDAEFIPAEELMRGTINSKGETTWVFSDNLYGPRAYANRLEESIKVLDEKLRQQDKLAKQISREEAKLETVTRKIKDAGPTDRQQRLLRQRTAAARSATRKLDELTKSDLHLRAVERQKFHNFLVQLASIDPDQIQSVRWGLSAFDAGFPVSRTEVLSVNELHIQVLEKNLARLRGEAEQIFRMPRSRREMRSVQLRDLKRQIEETLSDISKLRAQIEQARLPVGQPDDFGFSRDEFMSLWSKELTPNEIGSLRTEYAKLNSELNARVGQKSTPVYRNWATERIAENNVRIDAVTARMQEIRSTLDQAAARDVAIRKAKFLFDNFEDINFQGRMSVSNFKTTGRVRTRPAVSGAVGTSRQAPPVESVVEELSKIAPSDTAARNAALDRLNPQRPVAGGVAGNTIVDRTPIQIDADKALSRFLKQNNVKDKPNRIYNRRLTLTEAYEQSPEFLHLREVDEAQEAVRAAADARVAAGRKKAGLIEVKKNIQRVIAEKKGEVKELQIAEQVDKLNKIMSGAEAKTGKKLPRVGKGKPAESAAKAQGALEGRIAESKAGRKYFRLDEEMFGTLEQANNNQLSALQLRRRDIVNRIAKLEFDVLAEKQAQRDAEEAIKMLVSIGDRQAALLGLPSATKVRTQLNLAEQLRKRIPIRDRAFEGMERTARQIEEKFVPLKEAVDKAQAAFDVSRTMRRSLEENVDLAKRQIEEVRELSKKNTRIRGELRKSGAEWTEEFDEFLGEVSFLMPLIEGTEFEKPMKDAMASYIQAKAMILQNKFPLDAATQERNLLLGIKNMVTTNADEAMLTATGMGAMPLPNAVNLVKSFDEGFVQLSRYFPNVGVTKELAEIVQNVHRAQDPMIVRELSKFLSNYTRFFKAYATLSPGFHLRNAMSNGFMLFAAGGSPRFLSEGIKFSQSWTAASARGVTFEKWIQTVPQAQRQLVRDAMMAAAATGGGMIDDALKEGALWGTKTSRKIGQWMEQHSRFMLAYDGVRSGMDMQTAAARVRRFLIDYENVSNADLVLRQIIPFWMWTSRNLPMQIQNIWMNPKAYQMYGNIKRNLKDDEGDVPVPLWMREMGAFKLPFGQNWYATPDFGFNRLSQDVEQLRDPVRFLSNLNPLVRLPIELAGDRQLYSGRPFSDQPVEVAGGVSAVLHPLLQALGYGETGPTGKKFVDDKAYYALRSLIPTLSQAERLIPSTPTYQERGVLNPLLGYLGIPARPVTPQMQESEVRRIQAQLRELAARGTRLREGEE